MGGVKRQEAGELWTALAECDWESILQRLHGGHGALGFISSPLYMTDSEKAGAKDRIKTSKTRMASGVWMSNPQKQAAIKVWISEGQEPLEG